MGVIRPANPRLIEPYGVPEIYYSGIGAARLIGDGLIELLLYRTTTPAEYEGPQEHRVVARMMRPASTFQEDTQRVLDVISGNVRQFPRAG